MMTLTMTMLMMTMTTMNGDYDNDPLIAFMAMMGMMRILVAKVVLVTMVMRLTLLVGTIQQKKRELGDENTHFNRNVFLLKRIPELVVYELVLLCRPRLAVDRRLQKTYTPITLHHSAV